ncbi:MAG TPA: HAMP domain-containing sensor histidine kinase [Thermoanaerobaculia bacterium]
MGRRRVSVFAKLVTIMVLMAISLLAVVLAFFGLIVSPTMDHAAETVFREHIARVAADGIDLAQARRLSERANIQVRYEGPRGSWSTRDWMPSVAEARQDTYRFLGRGYYVVPARDGGAYVFGWMFRRSMINVHNMLLALLLGIMIAVIITAHLVLRRLLRPLRTLGDGVARLSDGQLDVVLPNPTRDEFGSLTDAFNDMVGRVRAMIRARDQLLLDVSHELRSPITRMRVAVELLPDDQNRRRMQNDLGEMELMIAELLELERLRDGRGLQLARHDLVALARELAVPVTSSAPEVFVDIDAEKMRTVIRNLLENAHKYASSATIDITATDGAAVLRVRDDGPGIPPDDLTSLFEPFFRVNRSRSKTTAGYGLGLSICKRIVEAHGGTIAAENNVGRGATFSVLLPR